MSIAAKVTAQLEEKLAEELGVPVLGVGCVNVVGTLGYLVGSSIGEAVSTVALGRSVSTQAIPKDALHREDGTSTKLPSAFVLAVTAEHVVVYDVRFGPFGRVKPKRELGRFDRSSSELTVWEDDLLTTYHLSSPGQELHFEMMGGSAAGGEHTRALADLIRGG